MIHSFTFDDLNIVLDVHSGAVHIVDEVTRKILEYYPLKNPHIIKKELSPLFGYETVEEALNEVEKLKEQGLLFSNDEIGREYRPGDNAVIKAMCLHLAHDCNLRCRYCFAGQGPFGGDRSLMSHRVGKGALDFLIKHSGPRRNVEVDFFGGEPLLNFEVLKKLVDYGKTAAAEAGKNIKFTVTTNGINLNETIAEYLVENGLSVVLSLDGRPSVHDKMRPFPGGKGSYNIAAPNIVNFIQKHNYHNYYVRGTFTRYNKDFAADVLHMAELGLKHLSVEPVVGGAGEDYSLRESDIQEVNGEYEELTRQLLARRREGREVDFFHFNIDLEGGPCLKKRISNCGAGNEYIAVTPDGDIYPCHQFVGQEGFKLGDVFNGISNNDTISYFQNAYIYNKEHCPQCWAKFYCSGGCHANAYFFNDTIYKPYEIGCELMKKRLECALYLKAKEMLDDSE
jgi:uncharacterized protein